MDDFTWQTILDAMIVQNIEDDHYLQYLRLILQTKLAVLELIQTTDLRQIIQDDPRYLKTFEAQQIQAKDGCLKF